MKRDINGIPFFMSHGLWTPALGIVCNYTFVSFSSISLNSFIKRRLKKALAIRIKGFLSQKTELLFFFCIQINNNWSCDKNGGVGAHYDPNQKSEREALQHGSAKQE